VLLMAASKISFCRTHYVQFSEILILSSYEYQRFMSTIFYHRKDIQNETHYRRLRFIKSFRSEVSRNRMVTSGHSKKLQGKCRRLSGEESWWIWTEKQLQRKRHTGTDRAF